ncbi:MAG: glycosyltransferase [Aulosira sp. DedQUE10]|nr:glycosyltransferase [Aulosira sp. DedQUE10]
MPTKVLELELSEKIVPIWGGEGYDSLLILVRYHQQPLSWVWVSISNPSTPMVSAEQLQQEIANQLGTELMRAVSKRNLSDRETSSKPPEAISPISVIVCTRDRTTQLERCLQSLLSLNYPNYEIIVVDNAPSNDETAKLVARLPVRYVREDRPGLDWARNRGITEARYDILAFTDDDVQVDNFWLQAITNAFAESEVMAVTGLVAPAELETLPQFLFEFDYGGMGKGFRRKMIRRDTLSEREIIWASSYGVGANMAFRRNLFAKIGFFDVALDVGTPSGGGGDIELFHRVVAQGHTLLYEPAMLVWHTHRRYFSALRQQIYDNGRAFGCYLLTCIRNQSVSRSSILKFWLSDWLGKWTLRNLIRPPRKLPRQLVVLELAGMFFSLFAYRATQASARRIATQPPKVSVGRMSDEVLL